MKSTFILSLCIASVAVFVVTLARPADAAVRTYYIAADETVWNYAPSGRDLVGGRALQPLGPSQLGWSYRKALYREYTDATFKHLKPRPSNEAYLGLLGPVLRAEVGDTIVIHFKNDTRLALSMHPHGLLYAKTSEGAPYRDGTPTNGKLSGAVAPGTTYTYVWKVPERSGPGPMDGSSVVWMYHSHTDETEDVDTGSIGPIVVTAKGMAKPDGSPKDVDAEVFTLFAEYVETQSRLFGASLADPKLNPRHITLKSPALDDSNSIVSINGYAFGNMPMIDLKRGQHVRWYVLATMSEFDFHAPDWHGETVMSDGNRTNVIQLGPMDMKAVDMWPDNPGTWLFNCDINVHRMAGMTARYTVPP